MRDNLKARLKDLADRGITRTPWKQSKGRQTAQRMERDAKAAIAAEVARPEAVPATKTPAESAALFIEEVAQLLKIPDVFTTSDSRISAALRRNVMDPATVRQTMLGFRDAVLVHTGRRRELIGDGL